MARSFAIYKDVIFVQKSGIMGYIHCCGGIRKAKSYALSPQRGYLYAQVDLLQECPVCFHTVVQITRMDLNNNVSVCRKINDKARKLFDKIKSEILYEKDKYKFVTNPTSKFYLYYNEYGIKKSVIQI